MIRQVLVYLLEYKHPDKDLKTLVELPSSLPPGEDLLFLKQAFLCRVNQEGKLGILGGDGNTTIEQLEILRFDEDFNQGILLEPNVVFRHGQKDLFARLQFQSLCTNTSFSTTVRLIGEAIESVVPRVDHETSTPSQETYECNSRISFNEFSIADHNNVSVLPIYQGTLACEAQRTTDLDTRALDSRLLGILEPQENLQRRNDAKTTSDELKDTSNYNKDTSQSAAKEKIQGKSASSASLFNSCFQNKERSQKLSPAVFLPPKLSVKLQKAVDEKKVLNHVTQFVTFFCKHLRLILHHEPDSKVWRQYLNLIYDEYPDLTAQEAVFSGRMKKHFRNARYQFNKKERNIDAGRLQSETIQTNLEEIEETNGNDDLQIIEINFRRRRVIVETNSKSNVKELLTLVPEYQELSKVVSDFLLMEVFKSTTKQAFQAKFEKNLSNFRDFLKVHLPIKHATGAKKNAPGEKPKPIDEMSDIEVLLIINNLCSTSKGVRKNVAQIALITSTKDESFEVFSPIETPTSVIYLNAEGILACARFFIADVISYEFRDSLSSFDIMFNLLALHYVFDLHYPAVYGVLNIIDKLCLSSGLTKQPSSQCLAQTNFLRKFDTFISKKK